MARRRIEAPWPAHWQSGMFECKASDTERTPAHFDEVIKWKHDVFTRTVPAEAVIVQVFLRGQTDILIGS